MRLRASVRLVALLVRLLTADCRRFWLAPRPARVVDTSLIASSNALSARPVFILLAAKSTTADSLVVAALSWVKSTEIASAVLAPAWTETVFDAVANRF